MSAVEGAEVPAAERSGLREWRRLIVSLILVFSPLLLAGATLEGLAWRIGETMPLAMASQWQDAAPGRVWRGGDGHSFLAYRVARIDDLKPEIIALGPSRANAFRGDGFAPYSFYNAGQTAWTFEQYQRFLDMIAHDGYAPRAVVFDLDYWMFSSGFDHYWASRFDPKPETHIANLLRVLGQLTTDPVDLLKRLGRTDREHGLFTLLTGEGFGPDGVLTPKPTTPDPQRLADDGTGAGVPPAVFADRIADEQVEAFERFVAAAKERHVALIGIQLPFYKKVLSALNDSPDAGIWREFQGDKWRQRLAASGVLFFDFADMPDYRDKPEYFTDSLDPDSRVVGQIMRTVMADPRVRDLLPKAAGQ